MGAFIGLIGEALEAHLAAKAEAAAVKEHLPQELNWLKRH